LSVANGCWNLLNDFKLLNQAEVGYTN
jgi:hypothetical protein